MSEEELAEMLFEAHKQGMLDAGCESDEEWVTLDKYNRAGWVAAARAARAVECL